MKLLGLSGSPTARSKTLIAVEKAIEFARESDFSIDTEIINIRDSGIQFCDGREPEKYEGRTQEIIQTVLRADALIVGTPMYRGSYTGILKNLFDIIPNNALIGKPVGLIATGGSDHHYLALEHELKPLLGFFQAHVLPGAVYANNSHYSEKTLVDEGIIERLRKLGRDVVQFHARMPRGIVGAEGPSIARKSLAG